MEYLEMIECGNGEYNMRVGAPRETSVCTDKGWIARITGVDPKYGYARTFLVRSRKTSHERTHYGLLEGCVYEYRHIFCPGQSNHSYSKYGGASGYFTVRDGNIVELTETDVCRLLSGQTHESVVCDPKSITRKRGESTAGKPGGSPRPDLTSFRD